MKTPRRSVQNVAKHAREADERARAKAGDKKADVNVGTVDSFVNFLHNLGIGADNAMTSSSYGFNPISRQRTLLEWIHRGSWLGGLAVDVVADDMTRAGVTHKGEVAPEDVEAMEELSTALGVWEKLNDTIKWSRLYGGAIAVLLIDGQDLSTPLRLNSIRKGQFGGILALDRWMVEPSLNDLVTEYGADFGNPKYYKVTAQAPGLNLMNIHHSRCIRLEGIRLPYWQRLMENLWGISVLERLYDRMVAFDSATTGAAQLVYKSYLRTMKIDGLRKVVAAGGEALAGLTSYVDMMRRFQGIEGVTVIDAADEMTADSHSAFGGLSDALAQFGQQLSGALQIPLVRLFGQSPAGFSTGDADLRNYYDGIKQRQVKDLKVGVTKIYRAIAASEGVDLPEGYSIDFNSLWEMDAADKANIAQVITSTVLDAEERGAVDRATALKELRQSSSITGIWSNITEEQIKEAEQEGPPLPEGTNLPTDQPVSEEVEVAAINAAGKAQPAGEEEGQQQLPGEGSGDKP